MIDNQDHILAYDFETSGIAFDSMVPVRKDDNSEEYQIVSAGLIVIDSTTYETVDKLYVEIKWNGKSDWAHQAEAVHGLSKEYLEENGMDEEDAVYEMANFMAKHFRLDRAIQSLGHNIGTFDIHFMRDIFYRQEVFIKLSNRCIDTSTLGTVLFGTLTSDQLFWYLGMPQRELHNALEDIEFTVDAARKCKVLANRFFK